MYTYVQVIQRHGLRNMEKKTIYIYDIFISYIYIYMNITVIEGNKVTPTLSQE